MKSIEVVTLDVTGTLIHCPRLFEIYAEVLERHGIEVEPLQLRAKFRTTWQELDCLTPTGLDRFSNHPGGPRGWWRRFLERLCELLDVEKPSKFAASELYSRFGLADSWQVYPEVFDALAYLRDRDYRLGILSNWDERLPSLLHSLGLAGHFEEITYSAALRVAKPNPRIFHHALERLRVEPDVAMHIGDSAKEDIEGALAAGVEAILLQRGAAAPGSIRDLEAAVREVEGRATRTTS